MVQKVIQKWPKMSLFANIGNLIPIWQLSIGSHFEPPRGGSKSWQKNKASQTRQKIAKNLKTDQKSDHFGTTFWHAFGPKSNIIPENVHLGCPVTPKWVQMVPNYQKCRQSAPKLCQNWSKHIKYYSKTDPKDPYNGAIFGACFSQPASRVGCPNQHKISKTNCRSLAPKGTVAGTALAHWIYIHIYNTWHEM